MCRSRLGSIDSARAMCRSGRADYEEANPPGEDPGCSGVFDSETTG